ncbi:LacI family DNA-binding transcriptional regulator [Ruficoccus amylovorans]|uniref:LacI family DNA-binding transcriptional regulator n=1 Tax=Ruficoccus amylovorans TaxID=1804625 RepID=A0A842HCL4_9BACT|nr:LacI family DNA-binding transcriptional regulator [Ruficoccus amylovorans]MBC2593808.1 LacI family DNA-binding transcriptional regulator [Ruficoccus amylovorans]
MGEKVTLATIAKMAKLSTAAVSNFINCTENFPLSEVKQSAVMEAMRQFNYRPSMASSQLRRNSVLAEKAIFIFGSYPTCPSYVSYRNPMLSELLIVLIDQLKLQLGLAMEIRSVGDESDIQSWNETIADAEAVICYGKLDEKLLRLSVRRNIPLVVISETDSMPVDSLSPWAKKQDMVFWNARDHLTLMLDYMLSKGAKHLAFVSSCNVKANHPEYFAIEAEAKIASFREFLLRHPEVSGELYSPPNWKKIIHIDYESRNTYEFLQNTSLKEFDAIVTHNDAVAQGVAWALQRQGLQLGKDVFVGGEGDYLHCRYAIPQISTVSYDKEKMAEALCRILKRKLTENRPMGECVSIPSNLIIRC